MYSMQAPTLADVVLRLQVMAQTSAHYT